MTLQRCPALLVSAAASGQGKTSVTAALARYHRNQGRRVQVFKTGPDFLDPMILNRASGYPVYQLDLWMVGQQACQQMLYQAAVTADLVLIEGVMGLFDGTPSSADLSQVLGIPVLAVVEASAMAQTFGAIAYGLAHYRPDLPFWGVLANRVANPGHAALLAESLPPGMSYLGALTRDGERVQSGIVITRKDRGVNRVEDLKGKTVMFGPKLSAARWVAAKSLFEENGINIDKDLKSYSNGGCCEDVAFNVYLKAVDAGVVCDHFLGEHEERQQELGVNAKEIMVIQRTHPVPTRVFASSKKTSIRVVKKINQALLGLNNMNPANKKILYPAEIGGFQKAKDEDYNNIRILTDSMK